MYAVFLLRKDEFSWQPQDISYHPSENDYRQSCFVFELIKTVITAIDTRTFIF